MRKVNGLLAMLCVASMAIGFGARGIINDSQSPTPAIIGSSVVTNLTCNEDEVIGYNQTKPGPRDLECINYDDRKALGYDD